MKWRNACRNFDRNYLITIELFNALQIAKTVVNRYYFFSQESFQLMHTIFLFIFDMIKREEEGMKK